MINNHNEALYYPHSFFSTSLKEVFFNNFIKITNNSIANRMSKIDFEEYQKIVSENLKSYNQEKNDNIKEEKKENDEALSKMLELQNLMK